MNAVESLLPVAALSVSLLAVLPIVLSGQRENLRECWTFIAGFIKFGIVLSLLPTVLSGATVEYTLVELLPGVGLTFRVDGLGMLFALVASGLWILTSCYSIGYMRGLKEHSQTRFFAFFALALFSTLGVAFAGNLLTLYLFYELLSLSTYPLVTHHQDAEAKSAGRKYLSYILGTSISLVLPAIIFVYILSGSLDFSAEGLLAGKASATTLSVLALFFLFGFAKAGLMPVHSWLPGAMVAPTPVSALLHAVAVVKVGVFCIIRVFTGVFGVDLMKTLTLSGISTQTLLCIIVSITLLGSSLIAISQDGLKRRLAFSTIGQLSYIILGTLLLVPQGMVGAMLHIAMHAFAKITLFFCAGAIFVASGKKYVSQLSGLGKRMPVTMAAFFIGTLGVVGMPPGGGFISKWHLILGTLTGEQMPFMVVYLLSSFLAAAYLFPVVFKAFFEKAPDSDEKDGLQEAPVFCLIALCTTAVLSIVLFFYPQPFYDLATQFVMGASG